MLSKFILLVLMVGLSHAAMAAVVTVEPTANSGWQLLVDGKPYFIKGVDYRLTKVGQSPDQGTLTDWAYDDFNRNGIIDGPYEAWVDGNFNNVKDADESNVGDFALMKQMGANTIRWYVNDFKDQEPNKELLRDLFHTYGISVAVGNKFGAYTIDSGASWQEGTDYRDPQQQQRLLASIRRMVLAHRDEPYLLLWVIGNENNYKWTNTNAGQHPIVYAQLVNEAAKIIHAMDPHHPVALVNGDAHFLSIYQQYCPDVDIFAKNTYRGSYGFGSLWKEVKNAFNRPVLLSEYGGSEAARKGEQGQAEYHKNNWLDIWRNRAGGEGEGNAIGGFIFEWVDEWWKAGEPSKHAKQGTVGTQGLDKPIWAQEHSGVFSQGSGRFSPFIRQPREVYEMYRELWKES